MGGTTGFKGFWITLCGLITNRDLKCRQTSQHVLCDNLFLKKKKCNCSTKLTNQTIAFSAWRDSVLHWIFVRIWTWISHLKSGYLCSGVNHTPWLISLFKICQPLILPSYIDKIGLYSPTNYHLNLHTWISLSTYYKFFPWPTFSSCFKK